MSAHHRPPDTLPLLTGVLLGVALTGILWWQSWRSSTDFLASEADTTYHAILLTNGEAYYGHIRERGPRFLRLTDVFYLKAEKTGEDGRPVIRLRKRGGEWHGPGHMDINLRQIVLIEPVGEDSEIGRMIRSRQSPPSTEPGQDKQ